MLTTLLTVFLPESCRIHTLSNWFFVLFSHVGMQAANLRLRPKDSVVEGQKLRAIVAQKPETSWKRPAFIASIFTKENIGRLYPILAIVLNHAWTAYFSAIVLWGAYIPIFKIYTTSRLRHLLAAMENPIRHWMNRPLSTWKLSALTLSTLKFGVCLQTKWSGQLPMVHLKSRIYTYQKLYLYKRI